MRLNPELVVVATLMLLIVIPHLSGQVQDPCITTERKIDLQDIPPQIEGVLTKRLEDHFYRLEGIMPGQRVTVEVEVRANISTAISLLLLREAQPKSFAKIGGEQLIVGRETQNLTLSWTEASPEWGQPALCLKVGQFSEARPVTSNYKIMVSVDDVADFRGGDAPSKPEKAVDIGQLSSGSPVTISGSLSSSVGGNDHTDYYIFTAALSKGDHIIVDVTSTPEDSVLDVTILDRDIFGLQSNKTTAGRAVLDMVWEKTETQTFYLKLSNNGGVGGEAKYTARLSVQRPTSATATTATTQQEQPTLEPTTARMIVFGGVTFVAALSVLALVMRLREPRIREVTPEEWQV